MGGQQRFDVRRDLSELLGVTGDVVLVEVAVVDDHEHVRLLAQGSMQLPQRLHQQQHAARC